MSSVKFLPENKLGSFLSGMEATSRFVNAHVGEGSLWKALDDVTVEQVAAGLRGPRPCNSCKSALMPVRELVSRYGPGDHEDPLEQAADRTTVLVGARNCGCRAIAYLDGVMLDEPERDPFYEARRSNTTIISVDCAKAAPTCFCNVLGEKAYCDEPVDVNLSPIEDGYVVEAGSEKGRQLLEKAADLLADATDAQLAQRDAMREKTAQELRAQNADYALPEEVKADLPKTVEEAFWRSELSECVQCGGCTAVCPTCYCFLLYDKSASGGGFERVRAWDSCQFTGYSTMAGVPGGPKPDPRRSHMSKFQHRFAHKFWYDPLNWNTVGCVGCGRCAETCPGSIDLRRVLSRVKEEAAKNG